MKSDYRIFVGAFPTGKLADQIQALRQQHDPKTAFITPPHVTLWGTVWRSGPATPENEAETIAKLETFAHQIQPFGLGLGGIASFPPGHRIIYLAVEKNEGLLAARHQLVSALGSDKHHHFTPHLTLTMRLNDQRSNALYAELLQSEWHLQRWSVPIEHLQLMQRGENDRAWRVIYRLKLQTY
ncbi:MAG: 2'-5' RNA ligase family protein [Caldilineaceae bacterium]